MNEKDLLVHFSSRGSPLGERSPFQEKCPTTSMIRLRVLGSLG